MKKALITGISGQDGSYLAELLLRKGYEVHGVVRRAAVEDPVGKFSNLSEILDKVTLHTASLLSHLSLYKVISLVRPEECYHLAASSFVSYSFDEESSILSNNFNGTHYLLASLRELVPNCKFFFAGSSEMFGRVSSTPQDESTPFNPRSIYGVSKLSSHHLVRNYREQYNMFVCTGILYNHESPRRDFKFVTRKITSHAARIKLGLAEKLRLGSLEAQRDWGYAPSYVHAMWLMLQNEEPRDYVISSGINHTVRDFVKAAFEYVELDYRDFVEIDSRFYREPEKIPLCGNPNKIFTDLGWKYSGNLENIVKEMN